MDSILTSINRIANTTQFNGVKLLNGSLDYTTSGVNLADFANVKVNAAPARFQSRQHRGRGDAVGPDGQDRLYEWCAGAGNPVTLQISGNLGTEQVSVQGGTDVAGMVAAINQVKNATGVSAATSGTALVLNSMNYGSDQYVSLSTVSGTFVPMANSSYGRDAGVTINGAAAEANGLNVSYRSNNLDIQLDLTAAFNTVGNDSFYITGGGAQFMLGPKVTEADKASLGIGSVAAGSLGDTTDGFLSTLGTGGANDLASDNLVTSQRIIEKAITQVATLRGRLVPSRRKSCCPTSTACPSHLRTLQPVRATSAMPTSRRKRPQ